MKDRLNSLQALRAIAFIQIFLSHCGNLDRRFPGAVGVSIFFVLSGFCMGINYLPKIGARKVSISENFKFAVAKVSKLYILHLIMLLVGLALKGFPFSINLLWSALLIQSWFPVTSVYFYGNSVAWYLSTYLFICFAAPYVLKWVARLNRKKVWLALAGTWAIMLVVAIAVWFAPPVPFSNNLPRWLTYICPPYRLLDFSMGILLGWLYLHRKADAGQQPHWLYTGMEAAVCALCLCVSWFFFSMPIRSLSVAALLAPISMWMVYLFALNRGHLTRALSNRFLIFLGNISSNTYLIHRQVIILSALIFAQIGFAGGGLLVLLIRVLVPFCATLLLSVGYQKLDVNNRLKRRFEAKR